MKLALATITALVAGTLATLPAAPSVAASSAFSLEGDFSAIVVDQAHGRVYLSGGTVATADLAGSVTGSVQGITAARQMTLSADGAWLVVANGDGLTVVDAVTGVVDRTVDTGTASCPDAVAPASEKIFFTYGDCEGGTPGLGAVDLDTDAVTTGLAPGAPAPVDALLDSVPAAPTMLAAMFGATLVVLDTTGGDEAPTATVRTSGPGGTGDPIRDLVVKGSGTRILTAGAGAYDRMFSTTTATTTYRNHANPVAPSAVAYRSDDAVFAVGFTTAGTVDVQTYFGSAQTPLNHSLFPSTTLLEQRGLAFGQHVLYAVGHAETGGYVLARATVGPPANIGVTTDHSIYRYKDYAVVTVALPSPTASRSVRLYSRTSSGKTLLRSGTVSATTRKIQFKIQVTRNTRFRAEFAGDDIYRASSSERMVKVRSKIVLSSSSTSMSGAYHRLKGSPAPQITGTVYPFGSGVCVSASGQLLVGSTWVQIGQSKCLTTTSTSRMGLRLYDFKPGDRIRVFAKVAETATNVESPQTVYYVLIT